MEDELKTPQSDNDIKLSYAKEISELTHEKILFTENVYARIPIGVEIYDVQGFLRSINDHALQMYGVKDRNSVVDKLNLFQSPYVDKDLKAKIQSGEDITLEFEYDFKRINRDAYYASSNQDTMIYEAKIAAIRNKNGSIIGHLLLANDVTKIKAAEFHTEETKKNLEMAMDAANMSTWVYDIHAMVFNPLYGNPIVKKDMPLEQLLAMLHQQDRSTLTRLFSRLVNKEIKYGNITVRHLNERDNSYRYYESRMRLSTEHFGKLLIIGTEMDVTEKTLMARKTQELITKRELVMQVSNIVHWDFDVRKRLFVSHHDKGENAGKEIFITLPQFFELIHPDDLTAIRDVVENMLSGHDANIDITCRFKAKHDDTWQYWQIIGVPFERDEEDNIVRYTGFRQNVSRVHQLKEKAELSDRLKSTFLANMSHEIRTPLNAIVGFSELLVYCDDMTEKEEYAGIIRSNNELLLRLIDDILDLSKIESGVLERKREKFNLANVCSELHTIMRSKITNPDVELIMCHGPACTILLDRNRLKQVWINFLTNAVKCTKSGHIKMGYSVAHNGVRIYVEDTGVGIPYELQDCVFGRFQKLNDFTQGTGLGLAISKAIVEGAGGRIGFNSNPGIGSEFWAWVPCEVTFD